MKPSKYLLIFLLLWLVYNQSRAQVPEALITVAEKSKFSQTSTHADVMAFVDYVASHSKFVHRESMLTSTEGKEVPMLVLAKPNISSPEEAKASGKLVIYIQGNIHGGEVEGKEAVMIQMREILFGDKQYLLDNQIIIFVPILTEVIDKLKAHGIAITQLKKAQTFSGEEFIVEKWELATAAFEKHNMATLTGNFQAATKKFAKGAYQIEMNQALANLIFYLLEPQSDDGLVTWNYFDEYLEKAGGSAKAVTFPVFKYW